MGHSLALLRLSAKSYTLGRRLKGYKEQDDKNWRGCSHSFGSAQTYALVNAYPTISDGIVLTGFSTNASFFGYFAAGGAFVQANLNQPFRFGNLSASTAETVLNMYSLTNLVAGVALSPGLDYPGGYLTNTDASSNQYLFLLPGYFDPMLLLYAEETKQPVTPGELLTIGSLPPVNEFAGPVLVIAGCESDLDASIEDSMLTPFPANDLPFCGGNCLATGNASVPSIPATVALSFRKVPSNNFEAYIQPNTGHGINLHYNATGAYDVINNFLNAKVWCLAEPKVLVGLNDV